MTESKRLAMHSKRNLEESMRPLTYKTCKDLQAPQALEVPVCLCTLGTSNQLDMATSHVKFAKTIEVPCTCDTTLKPSFQILRNVEIVT